LLRASLRLRRAGPRIVTRRSEKAWEREILMEFGALIRELIAKVHI